MGNSGSGAATRMAASGWKWPLHNDPGSQSGQNTMIAGCFANPVAALFSARIRCLLHAVIGANRAAHLSTGGMGSD